MSSSIIVAVKAAEITADGECLNSIVIAGTADKSRLHAAMNYGAEVCLRFPRKIQLRRDTACF